MIFLKSLWNVVPLYEFFYAVYRLSEAAQFFEILEKNHFWRCSIFAILKKLIDLIQTLFKTSILSSYLVLKPSPLVRIKLSVAPNENVRCGLKKTIVSYLKIEKLLTPSKNPHENTFLLLVHYLEGREYLRDLWYRF